MKTRGPTPFPRGLGTPPPLGRAPTSWAPWWLSDDHLLLCEVFRREKIIRSNLSGRNSAATRRNLGGSNLELRQSCSAGANFPPEGGNHRHRHHQRSSHRERVISINIFTSTISSQNPSSSLVSNSCLQIRDWC